MIRQDTGLFINSVNVETQNLRKEVEEKIDVGNLKYLIELTIVFQ